MRFYGLRIGAVRETQYNHPYGNAERGVNAGRWERGSDAYEEQVARMKGLWQSRRDLAQLVECCLQDDTVEWDHFYGVSANDRRWLDDLAYARETIGYEPQDNGEEWTARRNHRSKSEQFLPSSTWRIMPDVIFLIENAMAEEYDVSVEDATFEMETGRERNDPATGDQITTGPL